MTLEAGKEMDRRCVLNWLNEVYVAPSRAFDEYTEDELKIFAHDAIVLLKEQEKIVQCKDCKYYRYYGPDSYEYSECTIEMTDRPIPTWFCAGGERR